MWVRSEYANELAVLSAWIALLIPWNIASHTQEGEVFGEQVDNGIFFLRFPFGEVQFRSPATIEIDGEAVTADEPLDAAYAGVQAIGDIFVATPPQGVGFYDGTLWQANLLWTGAAVAFGLAFVLSIALYVREDAVVERLSIQPVRLMGALLGAGTLGLAGASVLFYLERDTVGLPIPIGVVVIGALALVLLRTKSIENESVN